MAWDKTPWAVGGGALHSVEVARLLAFATSGDREGIITPGDLKVTATAVPGENVQVASGAALILNRSAGGAQQTYIARRPSAEDLVKITATGSSGGRTDLVIAKIEDPQYPPTQIPPDWTDAQFVFTRVIEGVPAGTKSAKELNLGYPAIALARIALPANTATITNAMITDLRKVAIPKRQEEMFSTPSTGGPLLTPINALTSDVYVDWPKAAKWDVEVPDWATHAFVRADVVQYVLKGNTQAVGRARVRFGSVYGATSSYDENYGGTAHRNSIAMASKLAIPASMRGTVQTLSTQGLRSSTGAGYIDADVYTTNIASVTFTQEAV